MNNSGIFAFALAGIISGCSEPPAGAPPAEHVWSDQTRALDKARAVEQSVLDTAGRHREELDRQTR